MRGAIDDVGCAFDKRLQHLEAVLEAKKKSAQPPLPVRASPSIDLDEIRALVEEQTRRCVGEAVRSLEEESRSAQELAARNSEEIDALRKELQLLKQALLAGSVDEGEEGQHSVFSHNELASPAWQEDCALIA